MYQLQTKYADTYWVDVNTERYMNLRVAKFRAQEVAEENLGPAVRVYNVHTREVLVTYAPGGQVIQSEPLDG